jgi:hypothetical protein
LLAAGADDDLVGRIVEAVLLNFLQSASLSSGVPVMSVYLVRPSRMASIAASLMCSGVSKSGSPDDRPITSRPARWSSRAFWLAAPVGEGLIRFTRVARSDMSRHPSVGLRK